MGQIWSNHKISFLFIFLNLSRIKIILQCCRISPAEAEPRYPAAQTSWNNVWCGEMQHIYGPDGCLELGHTWNHRILGCPISILYITYSLYSLYSSYLGWCCGVSRLVVNLTYAPKYILWKLWSQSHWIIHRTRNIGGSTPLSVNPQRSMPKKMPKVIPNTCFSQRTEVLNWLENFRGPQL